MVYGKFGTCFIRFGSDFENLACVLSYGRSLVFFLFVSFRRRHRQRSFVLKAHSCSDVEGGRRRQQWYFDWMEEAFLPGEDFFGPDLWSRVSVPYERKILLEGTRFFSP